MFQFNVKIARANGRASFIIKSFSLIFANNDDHTILHFSVFRALYYMHGRSYGLFPISATANRK